MDKRWLALTVLCLGTLMIVLDTTIVNVALPSIKADLGFSDSSLAWVVNAYLLTFGGFLLLGGRLGDLYGHRRLFLIGISAFTLASLACGLARSQVVLIVARALQGLGGAVVTAVGLSLLTNLFQGKERPKAMGIFGFVAAGGGAVGVLAGGLVTNSFDWHWNFLINIPIGIIVLALAMRLLPHSRAERTSHKLDVFGALTVTTALILAVYAIVNGNLIGWKTTQTLGMLAGALALLALFIGIESRVKTPLMPLSLYRSRNVSVSNIVGVLWAAAMFSWFFLSALYMQLVLGYSPLQVGLSFLPANILMAAFSFRYSAKLVERFGLRKPLFFGLVVAGIGLLLFVRAPVDGTFLVNILPNMLLLGLGAGIAFNPVLLAAMSDVKPSESGIASGVVNTAFMMGGALGLAVLTSIAGAQTAKMLAAGAAVTSALNAGYHTAFLVGAIFAFLAACLGLLLIEKKVKGSAHAAH